MKKRLFTLIAALVAAVSFASAQNIDIRGTWRVTSVDGKTEFLKETYFIKMYTEKHFAWLIAESNGTIIGSASGTYTLANGTLTENIEKGSPGMISKGIPSKQTSKLTEEAGRMRVDTDTDNDDEIWEKID